MISYRIKNDKYIMAKGDGSFMALTREQVQEMNSVTGAILRGVCDYQEVDARKTKEIKL